MAFDNSRFLLHLMKTVPSEVSEMNETYRCNPTTLSQLQDKVLRSMVRKYDDENLQSQVVPQSDCVSKKEAAVLCLKSCALKCHENCSKDFSREVSSSIFDKRDNIEGTLQNLQRDVKKGITPLVSITTCSSPEPLRTPTFQFSPLSKSPARTSEGPLSPLAAMIMSPFGRKMSEDLSVYLPDNFTPVATLERLENSVTSTVFEFPTVAVNREDYHKTGGKFKRNGGEGIKSGCICSETDFDGHDRVDAENADVFVDLDAINCLEELQTIVNCEIESDAPERGQKKRKSQEELAENVLHFRNKLERRRRNEMNFKFDKLRQCIPAIEKREKVAKIVVLRSAIEYIRELQGQDSLLAKQKEFEKMKNGQLLKKLVKINS